MFWRLVGLEVNGMFDCGETVERLNFFLSLYFFLSFFRGGEQHLINRSYSLLQMLWDF